MSNPAEQLSRSQIEFRIDAIAGMADPEQWLSVEQIKALADYVVAMTAQSRSDGAREARLDEITNAWKNACDMPNADAICRSLAGRRRHLEAALDQESKG